jgi:PAP2 superfamily
MRRFALLATFSLSPAIHAAEPELRRVTAGETAADAAVCPVALAVAGTTGVLRVVADKHYASDVIAGAALGALVGLGVSAFHLQKADGPRHGLTTTQEGRGVAYFVGF